MPYEGKINFSYFLAKKCIFLQIKLHHASKLLKDYQKPKYEENRFLHLCQDLKILLDFYLISDPVEIISDFCNYFTNVGPTLANRIQTSNSSF